MFSERIDRLTSSLIRELLALTQKPDIISFAGGLPARQAMPPLDLADLPPDLSQYGTTDGEPELRAVIAAQPFWCQTLQLSTPLPTGTEAAENEIPRSLV